MNNICIKFVCTLTMFIILTGCERNIKKEDSVLATEPLAERVIIPPEFASLALEKTGDLGTWGKVRQIQLEGIVTFYDKDAGYYLTEQKYDVFPWSNSIVISGVESRKGYEWQLSQGKFSVLQGTGQPVNFKNQIHSSCFSEAILNLVTAPVRFVDNSFVYTRDTTEINLQGRWCYPVTREQAPDNVSDASVNNVVFYQNKADSLIDMVLLTCASDNASFLVCGYDYNEIKDAGISIPTRIEIHLADKDGVTERQLFRIDVSPEK